MSVVRLSSRVLQSPTGVFIRPQSIRIVGCRFYSDNSSQSNPKKELNFDNVSASFASKSTAELWRALIVFKLCSFPLIVQNSQALYNLSKKYLGRSLTEFGLKQTFFGHFCAGVSGEDLKPVLERLGRAGVGGILDYAAEKDVPEPRKDLNVPRSVIPDRIYDYEGEAACDNNAEIALKCIHTASQQKDGFAAIKLTALGKVELIRHISDVINDTRRIFTELSQDIVNPQDQRSYPISRRISWELFWKGIQQSGLQLSEKEARKLFDRIDTDKSGRINYLEWLNFVDAKTLGLGELSGFASQKLTEEEVQGLQNMLHRIGRLAQTAAEKKVRLMIDAEQSYFQPAIDHITLTLMRQYNANGFPAIYNTYQCYLKDSYSRMLLGYQQSQLYNFRFAFKAVRGAYMIQERKLAEEKGEADPIHDTINDTHANYHNVISFALENNKNVSVMVASHNERSVRFTVEKMQELGLRQSGSEVHFGQLLGMCDHVSYALGKSGYGVYKYLPYGPVDEVMPYLIRRAQENSDIMGGVTKERRLLWNEITQRRFILPRPAPATAPVHTA
eukprot:TRINITY_DN19023_c0_g1::TRINITY_DN19023_c0_g1_i1::g.21570::m.21570 TRINITY_DN19023_c0_g1::TRINITY_DN19023_c0_g1_i1::g.21570  ORF type:complete len:580 (+),score=139.17,sp/Q9WU79/PROD_MOUSE/38.80/3e-114,Pro_dh/PF01619.13/1.2e-71,EF-hand_8/PF13833.1/1.2e-05,EF-hand_8/PF13833.1/6.2e+03,EF-hand_1/PF00036.27/0.00031,EF-hand_7/PF13499.1/0.0014,EF-hand_5/PF13202.1/0.0038,EF-hand_6/PF13405.1/1e+04,EF-hand_6/PF13405.1/0.016,ATG19_autophagy/PF12744.2/5.3e+02,ATG19_autophagy/PF12744.2/0.17,Peptidase_C80/PF1